MIDVDGICKRFGDEMVLDRLSLRVEPGELFVLLGRNGTGKTTLLKCLVGLYVPFAGTITIDGLDRRRDHLAIRRFTAWLADQPQLYWTFTGRRWLQMVADLYGVAAGRRDSQVRELLELFDLGEMAGRRIGYYSRGQYKKLAIWSALVTNARLFLMDEPFTGEIDPPAVAALKEILGEMRRRQDITVVFSTQIADLVEGLASRVGVLHGGRIAALGTVAQLKDRHRADSLAGVVSAVASGRPRQGARAFLDTLGRQPPEV